MLLFFKKEALSYFFVANRLKLTAAVPSAISAAIPKALRAPCGPSTENNNAADAAPRDMPSIRVIASIPLAAPLRSMGPAVMIVRLFGV